MPAGLALPGGFVEIDENLEDAAYRELCEEAGVGRDDVILEQLAAYGAPGRDPRYRVVTVAWLALGAGLPEPTAGSDAAERAVGSGGVSVGARVGGVRGAGLRPRRAILRRRGRAGAGQAGGHRVRGGAVRRAFTVADLHAVYEAVWGIELDRANFHRKVTGVAGFLTPTGEVREGGRGRPARVYRGDPRATLSPPILRGDR